MARPPKTSAAPLTDRIARARAQGKTQQALELTHQFCKQSPTPENEELLRQVWLERGIQLQQQNRLRDAANVFGNALDHGGPPEFRALLAERLAACGDAARALKALSAEPDPRLRQRILGHLADAALRQGTAGKNTLPADIQPGFDAVVQAFAHGEAGRDDEARATLQAIGLASPFLEWKLLLRGLLAYYAHDDARAVENWQRLDAQRVPARLAAPLRFNIDKAFHRAQPPETQNILRQQATRLTSGQGLGPMLGELRKALGNRKSLAAAFRQVEQIAPVLQRDHPQLVPRLAKCCFGAIVDHGQAEDVDRFRRAFRGLATPSEISRLEALAMEVRDCLPEAHGAWQRFLDAVTAAPQEWPGAVGQRAQALVWDRMGLNALKQEKIAQEDKAPYFWFGEDTPLEPLKPGAAECLERSIALAPDRLDGYLALFRLYRIRGETAKARKFGQQLLKRFPDQAATSESLGDLYLETQEPAKARAYFEKALKANPLERRLRGKLARARQNLGLDLTVAKQFDAARAEYEAALALNELPPAPLLCQWAVLELKAGLHEAAAERIARAVQTPGQRLAARYALVSESIRAKLSPAERKRIAGELTAALTEAPTPAEVLGLLEAAADQRQRNLEAFRGQKTHERTFLRFVDKIPIDEFSEAELGKLLGHLQALDARAPWLRCVEYAERRFPSNPDFALSHVDYFLSQRDPRAWSVNQQLDRLRKIILTLPREAQERYLPRLRQCEERARELGGAPFGIIDRLFDGFGAGENEFEDPW